MVITYSPKIMIRTKLTVKSWPRTSCVLPGLINRRRQGKVKQPFQIKLTLPEKKTVKIKKGGNIIKTITARQKAKYFSNRNTRTLNV